MPNETGVSLEAVQRAPVRTGQPARRTRRDGPHPDAEPVAPSLDREGPRAGVRPGHGPASALQRDRARLFDRTSRVVTLTPEGQRLRAELTDAYDRLAAVLREAEARHRGVARVVRFGLLSASVSGPPLMAVVRAVEDAHPELRVQLLEVPYEDPFGALRRGEVDVAVSWLPVEQPDLVVGPAIQRDSRVLLVARDHPLATRESVTWDDVADHTVETFPAFAPETREEFIPTRTPSGRPIPRLGTSPRSVTDVTSLIARGRVVYPTVATFLDFYGHPQLVAVPLQARPVCVGLITLRRDVPDPVVTTVLRAAERSAVEL